MPKALDGRTVALTGAGGGIGAAAAIAMAAEGASVVVNDTDEARAYAVVKDIQGAGGKAAACVASIGDEASAAALLSTALDNFGDLHVLVNSAGIVRDRMIHNMTLEEFDQVIHVHLRGTWCNSREVIRYWRPKAKQEAEAIADPAERLHRKIINVTSLSGLRGNPGQSNYSAAKAGIVGLTKTLAKEVGPLSINVNVVAPVAHTDMTAGATAHLPDGPEKEAFWAKRIERSALRWIGQPDTVAPTFVFLASDASNYLTGQVFNSDGGANI
ncbi:SDR family oxidoreductase [Nocardioides sp.]|uniref:SDR family oxidoreductase n=1 Tax=Nocardioides sp. TaxID=35761 RepID=UPI002639EC38|nr:SDR family oxidoreductase [Nocardioides sp.]MDI6912487.1 SDR family oxidoreductase [Nocardioides sp.]